MGAREPFVLLETDKPDKQNIRSLLFSDPVNSVYFRAGDDISAFFRRIDEAVDDGLYVAGYFAYELGLLFEDRLIDPLADQTPLAWVGFFSGPTVADEAHRPPADSAEPEIADLKLNTTEAEYVDAVHRIKSHIEAGDTYQVNYTVKYRFRYTGSPASLYAALKTRQRVAYAALVDDGERSVISLSPELFVRKDGKRLESRPMKGTAGRGRWIDEDAALADWLKNDPKNRAENVMIVDLIRNDLGRLASQGGVSVSDLFDVEPFDTLFQMTSTVHAELDSEPKWEPFFRALFPCGSITGAPKIRTMQIIAELEKEPRGIYTGAIGYIAPNGSACFSVAIRTVVSDDTGRAEMGVGSGITYDSDPVAEYEECRLKARFLTDRPPAFSLIETLRLESGQFDLLDRHLKRLKQSAAYFGFADSIDGIALALAALASADPVGAFKVRVLARRDGAFDLEKEALGDPATVVSFRIADERVDSQDRFFFHKTTHRPLYDAATEIARRSRVDDLLFLNERGELTESTRYNLFLQLDGRLVTPPLNSGLLPGTLRQQLLDSGECEECVLVEADLRRAERIFLGNSVRGLVAAVQHS